MTAPLRVSALVSAGMLLIVVVVADASAAQPRPNPALPAAQGAVPLSADAMLERLVDPRAAAQPFPPGFRATQVSSHDRTGGNVDGGWYSEDLSPIPFAGAHPPYPTYIRDHGDGIVLLDEVGPGCLTRMWFTAAELREDNVPPYSQGDVTPWGRIQILIDGDEEPRLDLSLADLTAGLDPRFPPPLVGNRDTSSGGNYSYIPICYQSRLVLRTGRPSTPLGWHIFQLVKAPAGTPVEVFDPDAFDPTRALEEIEQLGTPPRPPDERASVHLAGDASSSQIFERRGAGTVERLNFTVEPFDVEALRSTELVVTVDGEEEPQIRAPLAALFGDGGTVREIRTPGFGMSPDRRTGYLSYPIPHGDGIEVEVVASGPEPISVNAGVWYGPAAPELGRLRVGHHTKTTELDADFEALKAAGAGHLVGWVLDLVGPPESSDGPLAAFMEGDERGYVDGSRSVAYYGTGTEDTFNGGFYYLNGAFALPMHGAGPFGSIGNQGTQSQYRHFGGDAWNWSSAIDLGMEHGGNNERGGGSATSTTFSYHRPSALVETDHVDIGSPASEQEHGMPTDVTRTHLTAYFEGRHDGTVPVSTVYVGGLYYASLPPEASPDGVTDDGITFDEPVDIGVSFDPRNDGVVLRRLVDVGEHPSQVQVSVDGDPVTVWSAPRVNPAKRWLEQDLDLPAWLTRGKDHLSLHLEPMAGTENLYDLRVYARQPRGTAPTTPESSLATSLAGDLPTTGSPPGLMGLALALLISLSWATARPTFRPHPLGGRG